MGEFSYDTDAFISICAITCSCLLLSFILFSYNTYKHVVGMYKWSRRRQIILIYGIMIICTLLLFIALWVYPHAELILIGVGTLLTVNIILFYNYMRETLKSHLEDHFNRYPDHVSLVAEPGHRGILGQQDYTQQKRELVGF